MTAVPAWLPGNLYQPGDLVIPRSSTVLLDGTLVNGNFEAGDTGWIKGTKWTISDTLPNSPFDGTYCANFGGAVATTADSHLVNTKIVPCTPGLVISLKAMIASAARPAVNGTSVAIFYWDSSSPGGYGSSGAVQVGYQSAASVNNNSSYQLNSYTSVAPAGAAYAQFAVHAYSNSGYPTNIQVDACSWNYAGIIPPTGIVFKATQTNAATSASVEPTWPTVLGNTVVDGGVTWTAVQSTQVTWTASPILVSGATEPTWSTDINGTVADNTIAWKAISRQIPDTKCPNTVPLAIAASKVFGADKDIIPFSETINPLDWSTPNDAGYLPFGLQTYGSSPVTALGLYRSNLVAFNAAAFQMWQVDQDPANMALLDAVPVGCIYPHSVIPYANDLGFLSAVGVRNVGIAGASTNLQANGVGEPIDPLVIAQIKTGLYDPLALFYPAAGQAWWIFGAQAFVLTITSSKTSSWSRYLFPSAITDWTLSGSELYLRSGTSVWNFSLDALYDDIGPGSQALTAGTVVNIIGFDANGGPTGTLSPSTLNGKDIIGIYTDSTGSLTFTVIISSTPSLSQDFFGQIQIFNADTGEFVACFNSADATYVAGLPNNSWTWDIPTAIFVDAVNYNIGFDEGTDFTGLVQWPHLDTGVIGQDKTIAGVDIVSIAPTGVTFSIGYDQRDLTKRTAAYALDADTLPGPMLPIEVTGPSFDLQLNFAAGQAWEHTAAILYIK